jgi:GTP cyclohydrolase I
MTDQEIWNDPRRGYVSNDIPELFSVPVPLIENFNNFRIPRDNTEELEAATALLRSLGLDTNEPHTADTPGRFVSMLRELTTRESFKFTTFDATSDEMVTLGPIPFYTLCAHHIIPFYGNAWVGYVPGKKIAGLSKIVRTVKMLAKGFHVQEELTGTIAEYLEQVLDPQGVAIVLKAEHLCMAMRGVQQPGVLTTTAKMTGVFADHTRTAKVEFLQWLT